ncbi:arabinosyltransferase domain-containing protein [Mycobacterium sp. 236(2023)]|uniref:arabinosyltransferase domain-containing protein n=1 Tax=Mycobacterium sp. 236(2023) TaxID=3038163 RepID=UPI0024155340|nr:arabinosyltransferase domain-containing protein [Mycobacterium sp. 236(2023)]MDG4663545.1 arabinosyltransferase domain-containing protein [Mycobacterium sp. 236(2023)]
MTSRDAATSRAPLSARWRANPMRPHTSKHQNLIALLVGLAGVTAALALPFAPVFAETTTLTWPAPGEPTESSSVLIAPYRPKHFTASIPCTALRSAAAQPEPVTVLATGTTGDGLIVTASPGGAVVRVNDRDVELVTPTSPRDCEVVVESTSGGMSVLGADGRAFVLASEPIPKVFGFRTGLDPAQAAGLTVTIAVTGPFATTPTSAKYGLVAVQLIAVAGALALLHRDRGPPVRRKRVQWRWRAAWWVDVAVVAIVGVWAVIGPLAVDDGWATTIARNFVATGSPGNYYRWWDAAEVPFAFSQQILAPLTEISIAPIWLRAPSTVLAVATWFVVSRGVLGVALPIHSATVRVRAVAALCLLVAWLPFNLGTRPESYVALGVTAALALAWRARRPAGVGWLALIVGLTIPVSPNGLLVAAPILVFAPRLVAAVRSTPHSGRHPAATMALVCCVGAVGLSVIFTDQTWDALLTATDWHAHFGPTLPWYAEPERYAHLLDAEQQGSFAKRVPVLFTIAMLPIAATLGVRWRGGGAATRLALVVVVALALLALGPSKWSYHLGALAGVFASFLTASVVLVARRSVTAGLRVGALGAAGSLLLAAAAALAFTGPNAWWLPAVYDLPWALDPIRPAGVSLDNPLLWVGVLAAGGLAAALVVGPARWTQVPALAPVVVTLVTFGTSLTVLVATFATAPLRQPQGSLAMTNLQRIASTRVCGLADAIEVLPDGAVLRAAEPRGRSSGITAPSGFTAMRGYFPGAPPPDPPGVGTSSYVWGSRDDGPEAVGEITTLWFDLPSLRSDEGVALSVSGRTSGANSLSLDFGRADGTDVALLGSVAPVDRPASDEDPTHPLWRTVGVDAVDIPQGADRVRIRAVDNRIDDLGWLAFTGPRLRAIVPLNAFLADHAPVLVSWPQAFLFPCVRDIAAISGGVAQTPRTVIESPRPWLTEDRKVSVGGTFAGLEIFDQLSEIPSRLSGHPEIDWGSITVYSDTAARDNYSRSTTRTRVWGLGATRDQEPER